MVSLTDIDHWSLRRTLSKAASDDLGQPVHARGFAAWIQHESPAQAALLRKLAVEAMAAMASVGPRQSSNAAVLGYAANIDASFKSSFDEAVTWLRERQYFSPGRAPGFEVDGLGLLGVSVGMLNSDGAADSPSRGWLKGLLGKSLALGRTPDWNEAMIAAAAEAMGALAAPSDLVSNDLRVALAGKGVSYATQAARASAWTLIAGLAGADDGMTRAAAQASALAALVRESSTLRTGSSSVADVANILGGTARSMRRWTWESKPRTPKSETARWVIDNEYHVQDMLWAILAPTFPDLDDEEWLKSLGQHHPRADLAIPSLRVIVEVKFARKGGKPFSALIQEVAADASTYLQDGSAYTSIVAFVWDDGARTEEHAELRQGLLRLPGVADAVILPRPSKMVRSPLPDTKDDTA